jgi:hypothetical protein
MAISLRHFFYFIPAILPCQPILSFVVLGQSGRGQDRASLFGFDPDEDISTSPIVEVIGKGAQSV